MKSDLDLLGDDPNRHDLGFKILGQPPRQIESGYLDVARDSILSYGEVHSALLTLPTYVQCYEFLGLPLDLAQVSTEDLVGLIGVVLEH